MAYKSLGNPGDIVVGSEFGGQPVYSTNLWNAWDDLALYKNLERRPNESNHVLRQRTILAVDYNSSKQGLVNVISDSLDLPKYNTYSKTMYYTNNVPLSYVAYMRLPDYVRATSEYYAPEVEADGEIIKFPVDELSVDEVQKEFENEYLYNVEKTEVYNSGVTWTLWKDMEQNYYSFWETSLPPSRLKLRYQFVIDNMLYVVEEAARRYVRDTNDNISEEWL